MSITRDDVAKRAGVSSATVSYVVNNGPRPVAADTRQRVLQAIAELEYHPSAIARSLKMSRTRVVGIVISDIQNPVLASLAKSAEDLLLGQGYSLTVCNSDESAERESIWLRMLLDRRMDGLILLPTGGNQDLLASMVESGRHITLIDRLVDWLPVDGVLIDNEAGAYEATAHLLARGHRRIGLLNLPSGLTPGQGRWRGYARALREAGVPLSERLVREGGFKAEDGYTLAGELLDETPAPSALLAASNSLARGVLEQLRARRLRMPDDLALCVFDDVAYYSFMSPSITAVEVDAAALAARAVQFTIERIDGTYTGEPRVARIPCRLRVRESTGG